MKFSQLPLIPVVSYELSEVDIRAIHRLLCPAALEVEIFAGIMKEAELREILLENPRLYHGLHNANDEQGKLVSDYLFYTTLIRCLLRHAGIVDRPLANTLTAAVEQMVQTHRADKRSDLEGQRLKPEVGLQIVIHTGREQHTLTFLATLGNLLLVIGGQLETTEGGEA